jgi:hypothetical protein
MSETFIVESDESTDYVVNEITVDRVIEDQEAETLLVEKVDTEVLVVTEGERGAIGPVGPASTGQTYTHSQSIPSETWTINHNLGQFPSVTVVDSAGTEVIGGVTYQNSNTIVLSFTAAFAGKAYLN